MRAWTAAVSSDNTGRHPQIRVLDAIAMATDDLVIIGGKRTPFTEWSGGKRGDGRPGGLLASVSAQELGAIAIKGALESTGTDPSAVDHVIMGYALQTCSQSIYGARHAGLGGGIPEEVPMLTVSRICGSGIQSIVNGAQMILLDEASTIVAGGMENLSQAPHVLRGGRSGWRLGRSPPVEDYLFTNWEDGRCSLFMAQTSDELCRRKGVTRAEADAFALRSHALTADSIASGRWAEEIVDVVIPSRRGDRIITSADEDHVVLDSNEAILAGLPTAFGPESLVTAANASGIVDGAAALVLKSASRASSDGDEALARIVSWGIVGLEPAIMSYGPVPSSKKALERAGLSVDDIDRWEINEAFAGQAVACVKDLGLEIDRVNVNGGAVGLGHPLAATGTRLVLTLAHELRRSGGRYGVATACIGGGQGIAMVIEAM